MELIIILSVLLLSSKIACDNSNEPNVQFDEYDGTSYDDDFYMTQENDFHYDQAQYYFGRRNADEEQLNDFQNQDQPNEGNYDAENQNSNIQGIIGDVAREVAPVVPDVLSTILNYHTSKREHKMHDAHGSDSHYDHHDQHHDQHHHNEQHHNLDQHHNHDQHHNQDHHHQTRSRSHSSNNNHPSTHHGKRTPNSNGHHGSKSHGSQHHRSHSHHH